MGVSPIWVKNMDEKKEIRTRILAARDALSKEERSKKSRIIIDKVMRHTSYQDSDILLAYIDFRGEVMTKALLEDAWRLGKAVYVPRVEKRQMEFYQIYSLSDLADGRWGIKEPRKGCAPLEVLRGRKPRILAVVPGVAFDRRGNRIGYGGGYYDRYFAKYPDIFRIALSYSMQIVPEIEAEKTDVTMDLIITEKEG